DTNIAFANELSMICRELNINVWELIELANRHPRVNILQPGCGVGGHCIAVDPWFIVSKTPEQAKLIRGAREVNDSKPLWVIQQAKQAVGDFLMKYPAKSAKDVTIACFGLTFKPDIDDMRESPALRIATEIAKEHPGKVLIVEPNIDELPAGKLSECQLVNQEAAFAQADVIVMLVDHKPFRETAAEKVKNHYLVDTRGVWTAQ